jgi:hypothetical protein
MALRLHLGGMALVGAFLVGIVGCGSDDGAAVPNVDSDAQTRLRVLANEYGEFMTANQGRVPKDEAEFRKFLEPRSKTVGASFKIETVDELLSSPRDQQPLVIVTGTKREPSEAPGAPWAFRAWAWTARYLPSASDMDPLNFRPRRRNRKFLPSKSRRRRCCGAITLAFLNTQGMEFFPALLLIS